MRLALSLTMRKMMTTRVKMLVPPLSPEKQRVMVTARRHTDLMRKLETTEREKTEKRGLPLLPEDLHLQRVLTLMATALGKFQNSLLGTTLPLTLSKKGKTKTMTLVWWTVPMLGRKDTRRGKRRATVKMTRKK